MIAKNKLKPTPLTVEALVQAVVNAQTPPSCHNMYGGENGALLQANLTRYLLELFALKPKFLFAGLAAGPNGARWTGVPFTDPLTLALRPVHVGAHNIFTDEYHVPQELVCENSGYPVWSLMRKHAKPWLLWNVLPRFPNETEEDGDEVSEKFRRAINRGEMTSFEPILASLLLLFNRVKYVVGVGDVATATVKAVLKSYTFPRTIKLFTATHPSSNRQNDFLTRANLILMDPDGVDPEHTYEPPLKKRNN